MLTGKHKPPTTLADVIEASGPLHRTPSRHRRYVPFGVSGAKIDPATAWGTSGKRPLTAWCVLDSGSGEWEEVASFEPDGGHGQAWSREQAVTLAARLNTIS